MADGRVEEERGELASVPRSRIAGRRARNIRTSQSTRPAASRSCQKRPRSRYSDPWWPSQNQSAAEPVVDAQPLAEEAPEHHHDECDEQHDRRRAAGPAARAAHERRQEEPAAHPRGGDPEDRRAGDARCGAGCRAASARGRSRRRRRAPPGSGRGRRRPGSGAGRARPRRRRTCRVARWLGVSFQPRARLSCRWPAPSSPPQPRIVELAEGEQDDAEPAEQRDQAEGAPQVGRRGRAVADQRLVGPVVRVGVVLPGTIGDRRPGGPGEVGVEGVELGGIRDVARREGPGRRSAPPKYSPHSPSGSRRRRPRPARTSVSLAGS